MNRKRVEGAHRSHAAGVLGFVLGGCWLGIPGASLGLGVLCVPTVHGNDKASGLPVERNEGEP